MLPELFNISPSNHWGEKFTTMTAMEGFQPVGENGDYPVDGMQEGFSKFLEHMTWKNSFSLSREIVEDGKLMDLKKQPAGFITSYYRTREKFGAALLGAAITGATSTKFYGKTFSTLGADGKCLFAKEHPSALGKKKQSNLFADGFSSDALAAAESAMQDFRGDNEEVLDVAPTTILIPNEYTLKRDGLRRNRRRQRPEHRQQRLQLQLWPLERHRLAVPQPVYHRRHEAVGAAGQQVQRGIRRRRVA